MKDMTKNLRLIFCLSSLAGDVDVRPCASPPAVIAQQENA